MDGVHALFLEIVGLGSCIHNLRTRTQERLTIHIHLHSSMHCVEHLCSLSPPANVHLYPCLLHQFTTRQDTGWGDLSVVVALRRPARLRPIGTSRASNPRVPVSVTTHRPTTLRGPDAFKLTARKLSPATPLL